MSFLAAQKGLSHEGEFSALGDPVFPQQKLELTSSGFFEARWYPHPPAPPARYTDAILNYEAGNEESRLKGICSGVGGSQSTPSARM